MSRPASCSSSPDLRQQPDPPTLVPPQVHHRTPLHRDPPQRRPQLRTAVAPQRPERVPRQALRVHPHHRHHLRPDGARGLRTGLTPARGTSRGDRRDQRHVLRPRTQVPVPHHPEPAVHRRELRRRRAVHPPRHRLPTRHLSGHRRRRVVHPPPRHQVRDRDQHQPVTLRQRRRVPQPHHRPVVVHQLRDTPDLAPPRQTHQVHRSLRVPRTMQHAPRHRPQRQHMTRPDQVHRTRRRVRQHPQRPRPVLRRDPRRHPRRRVHRHRVRRPPRILTVRHHQRQLQRVRRTAGIGAHRYPDECRIVHATHSADTPCAEKPCPPCSPGPASPPPAPDAPPGSRQRLLDRPQPHAPRPLRHRGALRGTLRPSRRAPGDHAGHQQAFDVLREHVHLEVHLVPASVAEQDPPPSSHVRDERRTSRRPRASPSTTPRSPRSSPSPPRSASDPQQRQQSTRSSQRSPGARLTSVPTPSTPPWTTRPPSRASARTARSQRLHRRPRHEVTQRSPPQRLRHHVRREPPVAPEARDRQAHPVHRDPATERCVRRRERPLDREHRILHRAAREPHPPHPAHLLHDLP